MQIKASKRQAAVGSIALLHLIAIGWLSSLQVNQGQIQDRLSPFDPHVLEGVVSAQSDHGARLATVENQLNQNSFDDQLAELETALSKSNAQLQALESARAEGETLYAVAEERLDAVEKNLAALDEKLVKAAALPVPANPASNTPLKPRKRPVPLPLPFSLIGIETRANESFASIAPHRSTRLDQIHLLKSGESFQNWRLLRIEPAGKAVFVSNGQERVATLQ